MYEDTKENPPGDTEEDDLAFSTVIGRDQGAPVVKVRGEIDLATIPELLDAIGVACSKLDGLPLAFVDLRHVRFIDVFGVRSLVEQAWAMQELGGELRLVVAEEGPVAYAFEILEAERLVELHHGLDVSVNQ
jgi:anti-anti-sigma factor